jgi:hypothetical protein
MGRRGATLMDDMPKGRPLAIDATAKSASPAEPAFIALPEGAGADVRARNGAALRLAMIGGHPRTALFRSAWIREDGDQPA